MNTAFSSRLPLASSTIAFALAGVALWIALGEARGSRRDVAAQVPSDSRVEELARRNEALASEIESLHGEVASLRASMERSGATSERQPVAAELAASAEPGATKAYPDDGMGEFQLRRELIRDFATLDASKRADAIAELAELARWGDKEALAIIVKSLDDESGKVRGRALRELSELDKANLASYLQKTVGDPSASVRGVVASRLDELPATEGGPMLMGLLQDSDPDVVTEAIKSAGKLEYAEARPLLAEQLKAKDLDVATCAANALVDLGDKDARAGTIERVLRDFAQGDTSGRIKNVRRLRRLHAVPQLERILDSDASLAVREEARAALAKLED